MEDLDEILLDQLNSARKTAKLIKKLKKYYKNEPRVLECEKNNNLRQQFFENMIENKSILNKKIRKKKINNDILKNNVFYTTCRYFFTVTIINYNLLSEITKNYFVLLRKDKK